VDKNEFIDQIWQNFSRMMTRITSRRRAADLPLHNISLSTLEKPGQLVLEFSNEEATHCLEIPVPYIDEHGNEVVGSTTQRAVGSWFLVDQVAGMPQGKRLNYWELLMFLLTERADWHFGHVPGVTKRIQLERILRSFEYKNTPITLRNTQRLINSVVNDLPVCGTPLQVWAMNKRIVFVDPTFDDLSPRDSLDYQEQKNRHFFPWSSIGLSDTAASKNYLLQVDLRTLSPFALQHHNPMRNLYQTLGMGGEELPLVQTVSARALEESGKERFGYNLMTCFLETPANFQDQLIVSDRLQHRVHTSTKDFLAFGEVLVAEGDIIDYGTLLANEPGNQVLVYHVHGDAAVVTSVEKEYAQFNNQQMEITRIRVESKRTLKDGSKFTNLHGNKGVALFTKTGKMYDPVRKKVVDIDLIVSSATIKSRRNFGQVLEALTTLVTGPTRRVLLKDDYHLDIASVKRTLKRLGANEDGTCSVDTPWGKFNTVCGWVFWGLIKDPEDALWVRGDVLKRSSVGIRTSGVKLSHVELRAMATNFGVESNIIKEVLSYQEGADVIDEFLTVLRSSRGEVRAETPVVDALSLKPVDQTTSVFHTKEEFLGTLSEEGSYENGLYIRLPFYFETRVPKSTADPIEELCAQGPVDKGYAGRIYRTNLVYVPFSDIREPWQHQSGLWGLSDVGGLVNNLLIALHEEQAETYLTNCVRVLKQYFASVATKLTTKWGLLACQGMSVRYPLASKATAALSESLPKNTIQIHSSMADVLGVVTGDVVLVERFPCLGFMSLRAQRVQVTDDESCRYVVRVSGNSLNSLDLDFDGDVLFVMSFKQRASRDELEMLLRYPPKEVGRYIQESCDRLKPGTNTITLDDAVGYSLNNGLPPLTFAPLTALTSSQIARALIGIKTGTGTSVALGYNILRLVEGACGVYDQELLAQSEMILNKVANSVFAGKHRIKALLESGALREQEVQA